MMNDRHPRRDPFAIRQMPHSGQARVAALRNIADCAGSAFGWDEDRDLRLDRAARLHAARRAFSWTLACIVLMMLIHSLAS